jgi:hypothetical protein
MLAVLVLNKFVWMNGIYHKKCFFMCVKFHLSTSLTSRTTEEMEIKFCVGVPAQKDFKFNETKVSQKAKNLYITCDIHI